MEMLKMLNIAAFHMKAAISAALSGGGDITEVPGYHL